MAWKEQAVTVSTPDDLVLEGVWQSGADRGAVVAPPHPEYGGSLESPIVNEIAFGLYQSGVGSLRFNWRGVGASGGELTGDPAVGTADYAAALDWIEESVEGPIVACGYSFGAATAVRAAVGRPRVQRLLLVAPPPVMVDPKMLESFPGAVDVMVGDRDEFAPLAGVEKLLEGCRRVASRSFPSATTSS